MGDLGKMGNDSQKSENGILGAIFFTIFIDLIGFSIIFPLLPSILQWYLPQGSEASLLGRMEALLQSISPAGDGNQVLTLVLFGGFIGSLFSVLQFLSSPVWGRLSDRLGRRKILLITTSLTCLAYVIWFFSANLWLFILGRMTCGLMAGNISVASAAVADVTNKNARTKGMAVIGIAFATGFMIGPAIGGVASMLDLTRFFPQLVPYGLNPFSGAALVSILLSLANLLWIAFYFRETLDVKLRKKQPLSINPLANLHLEKGPARDVTFVNFAFLTAFSGIEFTLTFLALERLGFGPRENISIFVFAGVVMSLAQGALTHRQSRRYKEKAIACTGIILGLVGMLILAFAYNIPLFFFGLFLKAIGMALFAPTLTSLLSLYTPPDRQGAAMGSFRAFGSLARAFGPMFAAILYWFSGSQITYALCSLMLIIPLYLAMKLPQPDKITEKN